LFFVQKEKWQDHDALHVFWLYGYTYYPKYKSNRLLPFYYRLQSKIDNRDLFLSPIYHSEIDGNERDRSVMWMYYWGNNTDTNENYSLLLPLYYRRVRSDDYSFLLSLPYYYSRTKGDTNERDNVYFGAPIVPLVLWASGEQKWDLTLFYFFRHRSAKRDIVTHTLPFYFYSAERDGSESLLVLPVYFHSKSPGSRFTGVLWLFYWTTSEESSTFFSPLYYSQKSSDSSLNYFLPFYLNYETKSSSFHLNLSGVSLTEEKTSNLPIGGEMRGNKLIVDWDLGWFYNLFRVSSRHAFQITNAPDAIEPKTDAGVNPHLVLKRERTRADSESFFGLYFLFGILANEKADHYRHFRLLPLSWLTWNTNSDQGVQTVVPFYVQYKDEFSKYLVIFPFYGMQEKSVEGRDCRDRKTAWVLITFWDEYECASEMSEQSILWPIVNRYESPTRGGYRVFPIFWRRWSKSGDTTYLTHYSPLHYTHADGDNYNTVSWLFYVSRSQYDKTWGVWALAHVNLSHDGKEAKYYFFPIYYSRSEYEAGRDKLVSFALLFWRYHEERKETEFTGHYNPLYLWLAEGDRTNYFFSWIFYRTETSHALTYGVPALLHRRVRNDGSYSNLYFFPFYYSWHKYGEGEIETTFLSPVFYRWASSRELTFGVPLVFGYANEERLFSWHLALITGYKSEATGYVRHHFLPIWWRSYTGSDSSLYLPFLLSAFKSSANGSRVFRAVLLGALYYQDSDYAEYDQTLGVALGALYYHNKTAARHFDSYGTLYGLLWHYETEDNYKRFSILTFVYSRTETEDGVRHKIFGIHVN